MSPLTSSSFIRRLVSDRAAAAIRVAARGAAAGRAAAARDVHAVYRLVFPQCGVAERCLASSPPLSGVVTFSGGTLAVLWRVAPPPA